MLWEGDMAACVVETGIFFWKKPCGAESMGNCGVCGLPVCGEHGVQPGAGSTFCQPCMVRHPFKVSALFKGDSGSSSV